MRMREQEQEITHLRPVLMETKRKTLLRGKRLRSRGSTMKVPV